MIKSKTFDGMKFETEAETESYNRNAYMNFIKNAIAEVAEKMDILKDFSFSEKMLVSIECNRRYYDLDFLPYNLQVDIFNYAVEFGLGCRPNYEGESFYIWILENTENIGNNPQGEI